ncbi:MAG: hypothetical protein V4441_11870, partial [Pseudomonadota bacterium]
YHGDLLIQSSGQCATVMLTPPPSFVSPKASKAGLPQRPGRKGGVPHHVIFGQVLDFPAFFVKCPAAQIDLFGASFRLEAQWAILSAR